MPEKDICTHLREKIAKHQEEINHLRNDLNSYGGIVPEIKCNDEAEELKKKIKEHRRAIEELRMGLESQGC